MKMIKGKLKKAILKTTEGEISEALSLMKNISNATKTIIISPKSIFPLVSNIVELLDFIKTSWLTDGFHQRLLLFSR
jgi:hypothetical protein